MTDKSPAILSPMPFIFLTVSPNTVIFSPYPSFLTCSTKNFSNSAIRSSSSAWTKLIVCFRLKKAMAGTIAFVVLIPQTKYMSISADFHYILLTRYLCMYVRQIQQVHLLLTDLLPLHEGSLRFRHHL